MSEAFQFLHFYLTGMGKPEDEGVYSIRETGERWDILENNFSLDVNEKCFPPLIPC